MIWKILDIVQTKDEEAIKTAYHKKLHSVNPEDDEEGFKELRGAYEEALEYANQEEVDGLHDANKEEDKGNFGRKNEVDLWIDRIDAIYQDVKTRRDEKKWDALLHDSICDDLDTELEAAEKLLVYFMSHSFMPQKIWQIVDNRFHYMDDYEQLKEKFPENYLDYVKWQIKSPNFIDFDLFDGKTDDKVDDYISKLYETKNVLEEKNLNKTKQLLKELSRYEIVHPFAKVEEARCLLLRQEEEAGGYAKEALSIMEELDFEYSDNPYIERVYAEALVENGEINKAKTIYDTLLEEAADNYSAMLGQANCVFLAGDAETAKEQIEDVLEERVQDTECLALLDRINEKLVVDYEAKLVEGMNRETCFKLGWCYYQQKEFKKGIELLDKLGEGEDYDYINLRCRLYLASEDYESAYPLTKKWVDLIENSKEDGSREIQKRKNRLSLAHFSVGICIWEVLYKQAEKEDDKKRKFADASSYIEKAISEENNLLVKLSYMEQLGRFYLDAKVYEECIEVCNKIIEIDRGFFPAYVHRQKANYELKNAKEVIDDYFACIEIYSEFAPPYILAAEVFLAFEQYDDVESVLEAAKEAGLKSDSLQLYRIKCIHYKDFSEENVQHAIKEIQILREKIRKKGEKGEEGEEESDIEDLAELEKEYAILYWDIDKVEQALEIIEDYLKKDSRNLTILHLKADILKREKRCEEALDICQLLVSLEPNNLYTRTKLGNCYERMGKLDKAIECYHTILTTDSEYVPALKRMMYLYSYLSNKDDGMEKCKQGIHYAGRLIETTGSAEGYLERGNLYIDLYELEKAVEDCNEAIKLEPDLYYAYNNLGCALLKLRRVDEAIEPLQKAIEIDADKDHLPYLNLAECYIVQKKYDKAVDAYKEVLRLRPDSAFWEKEIAKLYSKKKEFSKAFAIYEKQVTTILQRVKKSSVMEKLKFYVGAEVTKENEQLSELYCDIADTYRLAGNDEKAEKYYNKVCSLKHGMFKNYPPTAMEKAAEYYRDKGKMKQAETIILRALEHMYASDRGAKKEYQLIFVFATILFEQNRKKAAIKKADIYLKYLLEQYGGVENMLSDARYRPMRLYDLAIMHICAGRLQEGRTYLEQIAGCKLCVNCETCECFEYYFGMGLLAELEDNKEEARSLYKKAIEIKEDYPCAQRHLDNL